MKTKKCAFDNVFIQVDVGKQTAPVRGRMEGVILDLFEIFFCFTLFLFCLFEVSDSWAIQCKVCFRNEPSTLHECKQTTIYFDLRWSPMFVFNLFNLKQGIFLTTTRTKRRSKTTTIITTTTVANFTSQCIWFTWEERMNSVTIELNWIKKEEECGIWTEDFKMLTVMIIYALFSYTRSVT